MALKVNVDLFEGEALMEVNVVGGTDLEIVQMISALASIQIKLTEYIVEHHGMNIEKGDKNDVG